MRLAKGILLTRSEMEGYGSRKENMAMFNMRLLPKTCAGMLAPDGRCKTLDAGAEGYVRAEAGGALWLRCHRNVAGVTLGPDRPVRACSGSHAVIFSRGQLVWGDSLEAIRWCPDCLPGAIQVACQACSWKHASLFFASVPSGLGGAAVIWRS